MKKKLLSIITPSYNCVDKIENTILSVLKQDMKLVEYIVVDGKSTDGTNEILEKYKTSLVYTSEPDKGIYDAMNKGIDLAKGEYIFFLGAGDILKDKILDIVLKELKPQKNDFIYGNVYMPNVKTIWNGKYNNYKLTCCNICHQAIFYRKDLFNKLGKYGNKYSVYEDYYFNLKCFYEKNNITKMYIPYIIADYEGGGFSTININKDINFEKDFPYLIKKYLGNKYMYIFIIRKFFIKLSEKMKLRNFIKKIKFTRNLYIKLKK